MNFLLEAFYYQVAINQDISVNVKRSQCYVKLCKERTTGGVKANV